MIKVYWEDWNRVRAETDEEQDVMVNYTRQTVTLRKHGESQKQVIPMSRVYHILEDEPDDY